MTARIAFFCIVLAGCQQHVVEQYEKCRDVFQEDCVVLAAPVSRVEACESAMLDMGPPPNGSFKDKRAREVTK